MFRSSKLAALLVAAASIALLAFPVMASATATPDVQGDLLTVTSDGADEIVLSVVEVEGVRQIALNGAPTGLAAGAEARILVNAGGEDDVVNASALLAGDYRALTINGDAGLDILTGGGGTDVINGGDDVDELRGGDGADVLVGGKGDEVVVLGEGGDDRMIWNAAEGSDRNDGGDGIDTVVSNGAPAAETYTYERITEGEPPVERFLFQRTAGAPAFSINFTAERLEVNAGGGGDNLSPAGPGLGALSIVANAGEGNDTVTTGEGPDFLNGAEGDDVLKGGDGIDELRGGEGNDTLTAGKGNELVVFGEAGDDTMIWNPAEGNDLNDGGDGIDTVLSIGAAASETYTYEAKPEGRVLFQRTAGAGPFSIDFTAEKLEVNLLAGDDTIAPVGTGLEGLSLIANGDLGVDILTGAEGNDVLNGGDDVDELRGGAGNDRLTAGKGNELVVFGEAGNDTMVWNPAEGNDRNDGGDGIDTVLSIGAAASETYTYERIAEGEPPADRVLFQRTAGAGPFSINFTAERLEVNLLAGDDSIAPIGTGLNGLSLIANAGEGDDQVTGAEGIDELRGGDGNDVLTGGKGDEQVVFGEAGTDTMVWNPGDGNDKNDGGDGNDTVLSIGAAAAETYSYEAKPEGRVLFQRTAGAGLFNIDFTAERLEVLLLGGNDTIAPVGTGLAGLSLFANGGDGNDQLTGAEGADQLTGDTEDDVLNGGDGIDELRGGDGNDRLTGGKGDEQVVFGEAGDDTMIWNPGEGNDLNDGGEGIDTVLSIGAAAAETYTYGPVGNRVLFQRTAGAPAFSINFTAERLEVNALAGNDNLSPAAPGLGALSIIVNAGAGNDLVTTGEGADFLNGEAEDDVLNGGDGIDELRGGDGNDRLTGGKGDELVVLGEAGDDTMVWNPAEGNDLNDGGDGVDTVLSNGAAAAETYTYEVLNNRVLFQRTAGAPAFNINFTAERLEVNALAGNDEISPVGAGLADLSLIANAGPGADKVTGAEGKDTLNGGDDADELRGGEGEDALNGDAGDDALTGGKGTDTVAGGADDDRMIWNQGDGSDVNDGDGGIDTVVSNGGDAAETYDYAPNNDRVLFRRTAGAPAFSIDFTAEKLEINALGGNDVFAPAAPGLSTLEINVNAGVGNDTITGADGEDTLNGNEGDDAIVGGKGADTASGGDGNDTMTWNAGDGSDKNDGDAGIDTVVSNGANASEVYTYANVNDRVLFQRTAGAPAFSIDLLAENLIVKALGGDDQLGPVGTPPTGVAITVEAGEGNDTVAGGDGDDTLKGEGGDDRLAGGKGKDVHDASTGDDVIVWNNGDGSDSADGGAGFDTFENNGSPTAGDVNTLGRDVGGDLVFARTNFGAFTVTFDGAEADGGIEAVANNSGGGDDVFTVAAGLGGLFVSANGGAGDDELNGSEEADSFFGGQGNDKLTGGAGGDVLNGQTGDDQILARDGVADLIHGENGTDSAQTDELGLDQVDGVENLDALQPPVDPPVVTPPTPDTKATLPTVGAAKLAKAGKRLFAQLPLSCPAAETGGCTVSVTLQTAKPVRLGKVKAVLVLGSATVKLAPGATSTAKVALNPSAAALAKGGRLALKALIASSDSAGNTVNGSKALTLKVPRAKKK